VRETFFLLAAFGWPFYAQRKGVMDESEYLAYCNQVFGMEDIPNSGIVEQLFDEFGAIEGCYYVKPCPTEE